MSDRVPKGLPKADPTEELVETPAIRSERVRICDKCGKKAYRVSSGSSGVAAYCACGHWWAISSNAVGGTLPMTPARGLSKETLVEPDWDKAFEDMEGARNDEIGPKKRQ
jgi:hypothetical protein